MSSLGSRAEAEIAPELRLKGSRPRLSDLDCKLVPPSMTLQPDEIRALSAR